jgi:hypothetical protein
VITPPSLKQAKEDAWQGRLILNLFPLQRIITPPLAWVKISLAGRSSGLALSQPEANWHASDQLKAKRQKLRFFNETEAAVKLASVNSGSIMMKVGEYTHIAASWTCLAKA